MNSQRTKEKHLIFENNNGKDTNTKNNPYLAKYIWFWSDRLILFENVGNKNEEFYNFILFDLLMNESISTHFQKTNKFYRFDGIYLLNDEFGFITESSYEFNQHVSFVKLNWDTNEFELIENIKINCRYSQILVNQLNPLKFVVKWTHDFTTFNYQICKLIGGKIEFGEILQFDKSFNFYRNDKLINDEIKIYDLILKERQTFKLDTSLMPKNVAFSYYNCEWVEDRLCMLIEFLDTKNYGIAYTDLSEKSWKLLDFKTSLYIYQWRFSNGNLIMETKSASQYGEMYDRKIYSIPVEKPQSLRKSAWLLVIQVMKQKGEKDPYKSAKEFLPLNSDLREIWFKDKESGVISKAVKAFTNLLGQIGSKFKKS